MSGDNLRDREALRIADVRNLREVVGDAQLLVIDEAQRVENIGLSLKIVVDQLSGVAVIATGSASLDLAQSTEEALTGRAKVFTLYPLAYKELAGHYGTWEAKQQLEKWLIWGGYPEAVLIEDRDKRGDYLETLVGAYLYKDVLEYGGVRRPQVIEDLLRLLAFQIGQEVSLAELGQNLSLNAETVARYLDLLQKSFVVFNVRGFSRNLRKEVYKNSRYYFWDNGVRNALIGNFNEMKKRPDTGQLWENFLAIERLKHTANLGRGIRHYFWRTYDQKELDWVEEADGQISGFEFKWGKGGVKKTVEKEFVTAYPGARLNVISPENMGVFLGVESG
jgi:predicted AAA+ superfamily ATPase